MKSTNDHLTVGGGVSTLLHNSIIIVYYTVNFIITYLLYTQLFKENATFKLQFVLIVLPCKQQNVRCIRFLNYMRLPLKITSSYKNTHTVNIPNNTNFETKRSLDPQLQTIADECTLHFIVLRHFYVHVCYRHFVKDGFHTAGYRCVFAVKNVICVKTVLDWRNLRFKMELIREKGKQHDNADVTFWIVPTTDENWQARSDLSESVCS